jgi:hypothetical protein
MKIGSFTVVKSNNLFAGAWSEEGVYRETL